MGRTNPSGGKIEGEEGEHTRSLIAGRLFKERVVSGYSEVKHRVVLPIQKLAPPPKTTEPTINMNVAKNKAKTTLGNLFICL